MPGYVRIFKFYAVFIQIQTHSWVIFAVQQGHICHSKLGGELWFENNSGMLPLKAHACSLRFPQNINHSNYIPVVLMKCWPMCLLAARPPALLRRVFTTMDKLLWVNSQNYAHCRDSSNPAATVTQSNYDLLWRLVKTATLPLLRLHY